MTTTDLIATAALVLSAISIAVTVWPLILDRRRLKLTCRYHPGRDYATASLLITVVNLSRRSIRLAHLAGVDAQDQVRVELESYGESGEELPPLARKNIRVLYSDMFWGGLDHEGEHIGFQCGSIRLVDSTDKEFTVPGAEAALMKMWLDNE